MQGVQAPHGAWSKSSAYSNLDLASEKAPPGKVPPVPDHESSQESVSLLSQLNPFAKKSVQPSVDGGAGPSSAPPPAAAPPSKKGFFSGLFGGKNKEVEAQKQALKEEWTKQRFWVIVMLVASLVTLLLSIFKWSIFNLVAGIVGLVGGGVYFVASFVRSGIGSQVKLFYWPGLICGGVATASFIWNLYHVIRTAINPSFSETLGLVIQIVYLLLTGALGLPALWVWFKAFRIKRRLQALEESSAQP